MKRFPVLTILLILTACAAATESSTPTATSTTILTPSPTATESPTNTPTPPPTATLPYEPLEGSTYREIARIDLKGGILRQSELSPDGSMLAVLTGDGVYLYEPDTLEMLWFHQKNIVNPSYITWTADNNILWKVSFLPYYLLSSEDGSILKEIDEETTHIPFFPSPNGKYFASCRGSDCSISDTNTLEPLFDLTGSDDDLDLIWMPAGEHLISFQVDGPIAVWSVESGEIVQELANQYLHYSVGAAGFSSDGRYFSYIGYIYDPQLSQRVVRTMVWDLSTGEPLTVNELDGSPSDHGWRLDQHTFATNGGYVIHIDGAVAEVTRLHDGTWTTEKTYERLDGLLVVLIDAILFYDRNFNQINETVGHTGSGSGDANDAFSPDGQMLAIGEATRYYVWDTNQNEMLTAFADPAGFNGAWAAWSPDSKTLAIGTHLDDRIRFWDRETRTIQNVIDTDYHIRGLEWVDDSTLVVFLNNQKSWPNETRTGPDEEQFFLQVFNREQNEFVYVTPYPLYISGMKRSPDERFLAFVESSRFSEEEDKIRRLVVWDPHQHEVVFTTDVESLEPPRWLSDSSRIAMFEDHTLRIIDIRTGEESVTDFGEDNYLPFSFYLLGDYILEDDYKNDILVWYDFDGNILAVSDGGDARDPIITADGRILDAVITDPPSAILIELFPPEQ